MPSRHPTATQINLPWFRVHFSVLTLTVPFLSRHAYPLILSPSLSIVNKSTSQTKRSLGPGSHITSIAFDRIPDGSDNEQATTLHGGRTAELGALNTSTATHANDDRHRETRHHSA